MDNKIEKSEVSEAIEIKETMSALEASVKRLSEEVESVILMESLEDIHDIILGEQVALLDRINT